MADTHTLHVDVVSAEASLYSGEAEFVVLPGEAGELGIYPRHTPLITRIKPGAVRIKPAGGGDEELIFVAGGILEVQPKVVTGHDFRSYSLSIKQALTIGLLRAGCEVHDIGLALSPGCPAC